MIQQLVCSHVIVMRQEFQMETRKQRATKPEMVGGFYCSKNKLNSVLQIKGPVNSKLMSFKSSHTWQVPFD